MTSSVCAFLAVDHVQFWPRSVHYFPLRQTMRMDTSMPLSLWNKILLFIIALPCFALPAASAFVSIPQHRVHPKNNQIIIEATQSTNNNNNQRSLLRPLFSTDDSSQTTITPMPSANTISAYSGKTVFLTGATGGLGRALALELAQ